MSKAQFLTPDEVRDQHPSIYSVFWKKPATEPLNTRGVDESLHDYFMRKSLKCFCNTCRKPKKKTIA